MLVSSEVNYFAFFSSLEEFVDVNAKSTTGVYAPRKVLTAAFWSDAMNRHVLPNVDLS